MISSFRRMSKSTVGTLAMGLVLVLIVVGFAMGDIQNVLSGGLGGTGPGAKLVKVGSETVTERDIARTMERRLSQVRQQNPEADYRTLAPEFDRLLDALIDAKVLDAFAAKYGYVVSKRLIDAQIAQIPGTRGLDGQFSDQAYRAWLAQQRLSDEEVRDVIRTGILQQQLLAPVAAAARMPTGIATPYASMLLEVREGGIAFVPTAAFRATLKPTEADIQRFYTANRARFMIPEQRVLRIAKLGPERVAKVSASEQDIAAFYRANQALYGPKESRVISQAVVPDQAAAQAIAGRARGGQSFAAAAAPAGLSAADISVGPQTKQQFTELAGAQVANAAFGAAEGAIVGPIRSELGWHVVRIDRIEREPGKPLAAVRSQIAERLTAEKRSEALEALADQVQEALDDGASFSEAAAKAGLAPIETPPLTAAGTSRANPQFKLPAELMPAVKAGFELSENDEPVIDPLPGDSGYVLVQPARVIAAAPAPLASVREQVAEQWLASEATRRARALAEAIAARAGAAPLAQAARGAPVAVEVETIQARRIQLARFQGKVPPALGMLFSLGKGKARMVAGAEGEGFYVVKVDTIVPGNALSQPGLIRDTQRQMNEAASGEYAAQFQAAIGRTLTIKRDEKAIADAKRRITTGS